MVNSWTEDEASNRTIYEYDAYDRVIKTTNPDLTYSRVQYYDAWVYMNNTSRRVDFIDEEGKITTEYYDKQGRLRADHILHTQYYEYDKVGNLIKFTDAKGNQTLYNYDDLGRLISVSNALNETTRYEYDHFDRLIRVTFPDGAYKQKRYDQAGRLIETIDELGQTEQYKYDRNSNLVYMRDREGQTFTYTYNIRDLPVQVKGTNTDGVSVKTYTYNAAGQVLTATVDGLTFSYTYHPDDGTLIEIKYPDNRTTKVNRYLGQSHTEIIDPFGQRIHYLYDNRNRLDYIILGTVNSSREVDYTYTGNNKIASITFNGGMKQINSYGTNNAHLLSSVTHRAPNNALLNQYTYSYDENFNIASIGSQTDPPNSMVNHFYTYDVLNRIKTSTDGNEVYNYDNRGNRLTLQTDQEIDFTTQEYKYNVWGQLVEVTTEEGTVRYSYDPEGLFYERTDENGQKTRYYYLNSQLIAEGLVTSSGTATLKTRYVYGHDIAFQMNASGEKAYYLLNGHGDVVELRTAQGQLLNEYEYDIWGNPKYTYETRHNLFRYSGEYWDDFTGLQYLRARWYDPSIARFITEDTYEGELTNPLSLNLYTYVYNNPLIYVDPTGNVPKWLKSIGKGIKAVVDFVILDDIKTVVSRDASMGERALAAVSIIPVGKVVKVIKTADKLGDASKLTKTVNKACNCFTAGTKVLTDEGEKPIEEIKVGDKVLAKDDETGEMAYKEVEWLFQRDVEETYNITVGDEVITTTDEHPFWIVGKGWVEAQHLAVGDVLTTSDGKELAIENIEVKKEHMTVYNFMVKDFHTYFVTNLGIWTHNACSTPNTTTKWDTKSNAKAELTYNFHGQKVKAYQDSNGYWWAKDTTGHGGSAYKVFEKKGKELHWVADADEYGNWITDKHKSQTGMVIKLN